MAVCDTDPALIFYRKFLYLESDHGCCKDVRCELQLWHVRFSYELTILGYSTPIVPVDKRRARKFPKVRLGSEAVKQGRHVRNILIGNPQILLGTWLATLPNRLWLE